MKKQASASLGNLEDDDAQVDELGGELLVAVDVAVHGQLHERRLHRLSSELVSVDLRVDVRLAERPFQSEVEHTHWIRQFSLANLQQQRHVTRQSTCRTRNRASELNAKNILLYLV